MAENRDNIQCITERVKQLLKELFAAHVELATEAKKWKKKCQKNKSNETSKCSPSLFDASNRSSHSSSFLNLPSTKDKAAQIIVTNPVKLSSCNPCFIQKSLTSRNENTANSNKSVCKKVTESSGSIACDIKKTIAKSSCNVKTNKLCLTSTDKTRSSVIQKLSGENLPTIFDSHINSDSERDFQSPEPFIPSWKRRELTRPPLVVPDTEPTYYEDFKTSTPCRLKSEISRNTTFKCETDCLNSPEKKKIKANVSSEKQSMKDEKDLRPSFVKIRQCGKDLSGKLGTTNERSDSIGIAETLREFISPSPDKKKPLKNQKFLKKQTSMIESCKIKRGVELDSSPRDDTFSFFIQSPEKDKNLVESEHGMLAKDMHRKHCVASGETVKREFGSSRERDSIEFEQKCLNSSSSDPEAKGFDGQLDQPTDEELHFSDSFDPDETYCPIMREKEMLSRQRDCKAPSSLNNASMIPGLRLSQYCTIDPDQTMDPNLVTVDSGSASEVSVNVLSHQQIKTPSPFPSSPDELSQELIAFNPADGKFTAKPRQRSSPAVSNVNTNPVSTITFSGNGGVTTTIGVKLDENEELTTDGEEKENTSLNNFKQPAALDDSFNRVPTKYSGAPEFAYVDVVRKRSERYKLDAFACEQCKKWYDAAGLTEEEKKERMKSCRHRSKFEPTSTPEHYWSIGFPDTEACKERGYVEIEDDANKPIVNRARRKRAYRKIF